MIINLIYIILIPSLHFVTLLGLTSACVPDTHAINSQLVSHFLNWQFSTLNEHRITYSLSFLRIATSQRCVIILNHSLSNSTLIPF